MSKYWDNVKRLRRERSAMVLRLLEEGNGRTLDEVGKLLGGLTRQRVGQLAAQGRRDRQAE